MSSSTFHFSIRSITLLLLCLCLGLFPAKGSALCCVDDDTGGIWWSRSGGRMALLAGGAIALGAIAGAIAGYSASSCHSSHSCRSSTYTTGPGTQPFANEFQPISLSSSSSGYSYFESSISESINPLLRRSQSLPQTKAKTKISKEGSSSSSRRSHQRQSADETKEITFNFSVTLANHAGVSLFTPFVTTAEGETIEGHPKQIAPNCTSLQLYPIKVAKAKPGTYRLGIRVAQVGSHRSASHWQGEFTAVASQQDGTATYLSGHLREGDPISIREYLLQE